MYHTYVTNKSHCFKYPDVQGPASSMIYELVNKGHSIGPFLNKKYIRQNVVLTEEKLDKI
jgi:hypothetical protein